MQQQRCEILQETLGMRITHMEELEFLRMLPLHLIKQSWRLWLLGIPVSVTTSKSEVQSEIIDLENDDDMFI